MAAMVGKKISCPSLAEVKMSSEHYHKCFRKIDDCEVIPTRSSVQAAVIFQKTVENKKKQIKT